jgi:hypothetical protein
LVGKRGIPGSVEGFTALLELLAEAGDNPEDPIPVAIETPRGLLVAALRTTGASDIPINPMAVARYRERHTVARSKSDHADAMALANIWRTDVHAHRRLPADSELVRSIAVLARAHQDAIWRRTTASIAAVRASCLAVAHRPVRLAEGSMRTCSRWLRSCGRCSRPT